MAEPRNSRSTDLPRALASFFAPRLSSSGIFGRRICVGLSGGRDSVVLLHALTALPRERFPAEISALHVHHGLSPHADRWTRFCESFCERLGVHLTVRRVIVDMAAGEGLEAAARRARHAAFVEHVASAAVDWLALAHHRDDQAETLLLNLLRGAGVAGLAGMPAERSLAGAPSRLVRPLLDIPRSAFEAYLNKHALDWVEDESNGDTELRRNYLRAEILPRLEAVFPAPSVMLARAAGHCREAMQLADEVAASDRMACALASGRVAASALRNLSPARRTNLLRYELRSAGLRAPDTRYLLEILNQLMNCGHGANPAFIIDGGELRLYRGELHVLGQPEPIPEALAWQGEALVPWAGGQVVFSSAAGCGISRGRLGTMPLWLRSRRGGERLQLGALTPRRALKKILQESAMPPWERERLPLLCCGDVPVWVGGVGVDAAWCAAPDEPGLLVEWLPD